MSEYRVSLAGTAPCDVAVAGGGIAGVYAALGAAACGARVALVEEQGFVGGQATAGGVHTFCGETRLVNDPWRLMLSRLAALDGIADYRPNDDGRAFDCEALKLVLQQMLAEAGVRVLLHTRLIDVERESSDRVAALVIHNKSGLSRLACLQAIDATGDADLVARGGWPWLKGGPALKPGAKPQLDAGSPPRQLPMSLYFTLVDQGRQVRTYLPPGCPEFGGDDDLPMVTVIPEPARIMVKMKVIGFDATDGESLAGAEQAARRQMMGVVHHLQTKGYRGRRYPTFRLAWTAPHIGIREGRRVLGQYSLTIDDVLGGRSQPDAVAVGSYHVDYHWPNVMQRAGTGVTTQCPPYQIPFRSLRPRGAANLLVPGRCLAGEQMAMSSYRVMGTCAQTGFAAGVAAAMAVSRRCELDELDQRELRSRLRTLGLRLDQAPYESYLRARRGFAGTAARAGGPVGAVALALMPDGSVVVAWSEGGQGGRALACTRREQQWGKPVVAIDGIAAGAVRLTHAGGARLPADPDRRVEETEEPPALTLEVGGKAAVSSDCGATWTAATGGAADDKASDGGGLTWLPQRGLDADPSVSPAVAASSSGIVAAFAGPDRTIRVVGLPADALLPAAAGEQQKGEWHHDDSSWLDLLKDVPLDPQVERR